jgi:membrane-bound lytic murein transglycosylase B|tara:strand:- start:3786 stop:4748 length:963 start_codon:yes stop_codon:yes gene_type:complete
MERISCFMICLWALFFKTLGQIDENKVTRFVLNYSKTQDVRAEAVRSILDSAQYIPEIIERISRPAEGISWKRYRKIFLTNERITKGVNFWNDHESTLNAVSKDTGVEIEYLIAILGVETYYGEKKGAYKVLDALYTLAFAYPKRANFFTKELGEFITLSITQNLDLYNAEGSYAGAIGYCQFMPSSYRAYAKSFDGSKDCDLVNNVDDAIASAANYLKMHKWKKGQKVALPVNKIDKDISSSQLYTKPKNTIEYYRDKGYQVEGQIQTDLVSLIELDNEISKEYWMGFHNFYVITRYNHSPLYAMAVHQLAQAIRTLRN